MTADGGFTTYNYDRLGRLTGRVLPDGTVTGYVTDTHGRLTMLSHEKDGVILDRFSYEYDSVGNITSVDKQRMGLDADSGLFTYGYDKLDRLVSVGHGGNERAYSYDGFGNRVASVDNGVVTGYTYDIANRLTTMEAGGVRHGYGYDGRGNLREVTSDGMVTARYTFDATNRLTEAVTGVGTARYGYNGMLARVMKTEEVDGLVRETRHTLDLTLSYDNLLMEDDGCERSFVWGNGLIAARDDENEMFFFHDHLGSPVRLMGSVGDTGHGVPMAYDEFGGRLHGTNTFGQPFGFTGYQDEDVTGLYYAQARYYEPRGGRFIAEDPFWAIQRIYEHNLQGLNLYLYCLNDPVSRIDPSGLDNWFLYDPKDFSDHVESELMRLRDSYGTTAHAIPVTTVAEFIDAWNSIGAGGVTIDAVSLLFHGSSQTINIDSDDNQYLTLLSTGLTPEGNPALFIGDLQDKAISVLYLMTCNSGHLDRKVNLPTAFLDNFNGISNVIGWDGGTAYTRYMYFDDNNVPQTYYNVRLAINQTGRFRSYAPPIGPFGLFRRSPVGMVNYSRDGIEVLGTPKISPDTIIDGRMIYRSPR